MKYLGMTTDEMKAEALAFVRRFGYDHDSLPRGRQCQGGQCPIARALTVAGKDGAATISTMSAFYEEADSVEFRRTVHHPVGVRQFVIAFDEGEIPELIDTLDHLRR